MNLSKLKTNSMERSFGYCGFRGWNSDNTNN